MKTSVLLNALWPLLGTLGCAPDVAPDPYDVVTLVADASAPRPKRPTPSTSDAGTPRDPELAEDDAEVAFPEPDPTAEVGTANGKPVTPPEAGPCDLSGRWLMNERMLTNAVGAKQLINNWFYVELTQQGTQVVFSKSLACGTKVVGLQPVIISMDDSKAWPSYMQHDTYWGRKGTSTPADEGCNVVIEKMAIVRGATVETYRDLDQPLPTLEEPATDAVSGWEDWDDDGHPGISMRVSGTVTGMLYAATRSWTQHTGAIESNASSFVLPTLWSQERTTLGYEGSPLLTADAGRDSDATQHFVEWARLSEEQSAGDDAAKCKAVRDLAPALTPRAMK